MSRWRVRIAAFLLVVFSAVEIFAAAPELHNHPVDIGGSTTTVITRAAVSQRPVDCLACRIANLVVAVSSGPRVPLPAALSLRIAVAAPSFVTPVRLDGVFGRAPPAA
ncbi:MAG: hypothetical protein WBX15_16100 [Thermoanaerobaculia bacterium]